MVHKEKKKHLTIYRSEEESVKDGKVKDATDTSINKLVNMFLNKMHKKYL